jgi:hypothetical protein
MCSEMIEIQLMTSLLEIRPSWIYIKTKTRKERGRLRSKVKLQTIMHWALCDVIIGVINKHYLYICSDSEDVAVSGLPRQ